MKLFEYAIIHTETATKKHTDEGRRPKSTLLKDVTRVLAADEREVNILAAREIPTEYNDRLSEVAIAVRPF